ncbi:MAG: hypothetical protein PUA72_05945 [Lachnospiraceae bacterium]|nr:hypothetical protein [Lachnospiraceae bacterium]
MSTSPKIVVLKTREILYTLILLFLAILLIVCLILMFAPKKDASETATLPSGHAGSESSRTAAYVPGIYTAPVTLGEDTMNVEVTVDTNEIQSIRLVNLSEATAASYPLVSPSLEEIAAQILEKQSLDDITCPAENRYTAQLLLLAISDALATAAV